MAFDLFHSLFFSSILSRRVSFARLSILRALFATLSDPHTPWQLKFSFLFHFPLLYYFVGILIPAKQFN